MLVREHCLTSALASSPSALSDGDSESESGQNQTHIWVIIVSLIVAEVYLDCVSVGVQVEFSAERSSVFVSEAAAVARERVRRMVLHRRSQGRDCALANPRASRLGSYGSEYYQSSPSPHRRHGGHHNTMD